MEYLSSNDETGHVIASMTEFFTLECDGAHEEDYGSVLKIVLLSLLRRLKIFLFFLFFILVCWSAAGAERGI